MKFKYKYSDNLKCATRGEQPSNVEIRTIEAESEYDAMVKIFAILQQDEYFGDDEDTIREDCPDMESITDRFNQIDISSGESFVYWVKAAKTKAKIWDLGAED